jgi:hypothetical protein
VNKDLERFIQRLASAGVEIPAALERYKDKEPWLRAAMLEPEEQTSAPQPEPTPCPKPAPSIREQFTWQW